MKSQRAFLINMLLFCELCVNSLHSSPPPSLTSLSPLSHSLTSLPPLSHSLTSLPPSLRHRSVSINVGQSCRQAFDHIVVDSYQSILNSSDLAHIL